MTVYQFGIFSNGADKEAAILRDTVLEKMRDLGCPQASLRFLGESDLASIDHKAPLVGAYLSVEENPSRSEELVAIVKRGIMVVPVVKSLQKFTSFVFEELLPINGMEITSNDPRLEKVAAVLLEGMGMLRRTRRLFISYRRVETQGVAIQLYELLDAYGFDVFLDTHSVRPGEPFQEVLWHRLSDTDVVVLLGSPGFLESRWTEEELANANSTNIQILHLVWPETTFREIAAFSRPFVLNNSDFNGVNLGSGARLKRAVAERIATEVESLRARALAARYTYLVQEFCEEATNLGLEPHVQPDRFITMEPKPGLFVVAVPTVGIPDAVRYQEVEDRLHEHVCDDAELVLLYDERGIRDKWITHLEWLDHHKLRVRSLQVAQAASWLKGLLL